MDPELQQQVLRGIDKLCQGKTLIVIAHRLKTIEQADQILLLEKGRLIARGNHAELAKTNDTYRAMLDCFLRRFRAGEEQCKSGFVQW